jgi:hypothetical protein
MPVRASLGAGRIEWLHPTQTWQSVQTDLASVRDFAVDPNFYVRARGVAR